jgi:hypothetical protein
MLHCLPFIPPSRTGGKSLDFYGRGLMVKVEPCGVHYHKNQKLVTVNH